MKEWKVLPTDPRFQDLTSEQYAFLFEFWKKENAPKKSSAHDDDYDDAVDENGIPYNQQKYIDPDFDAEWNNLTIEDDDGGDMPPPNDFVEVD